MTHSFQVVKCFCEFGAPGRIRTAGFHFRRVNFYPLNYWGIFGDSPRTRTETPFGHDILSVACTTNFIREPKSGDQGGILTHALSVCSGML